MPLVRVLADMEMAGVRIDKEALSQSSLVLNEMIQKTEQKSFESAGMEFNVSSPKTVGEVLFDKLKIDSKAKKTKTGQYSTSEETLDKVADKHHVVHMLL